MLYLAVQFAWFLLAAFMIGLVFGWLTLRGGLRGFLSGPAFALLVAWAAAAALVWFRLVNDQAAFWIETALLHLLAYVAGCLIGGLLQGDAEQAVPALAAPAPRLALPGPAPALAPPIPVAAPAEAEPAPMPKLAGEDALAGQRPTGFVAARGGVADDLKLIKGVGPQNEERLHKLGIWHFSQIAAWTSQNVEWVGAYLAFPGRIEREEWVAQAAALAGTAPQGEAVAANAAAMSGAALEGTRPTNLLPAARGGKPDDLGLIDGVGPAIAEKLNEFGLWHFDQIAALGPDELRFVAHHAGFPGRDLVEGWKAEAEILAKGGETAHSRAVKAKRKKKR
jgi:predicted flap endonuclease-1-like 5' DNA nuclease